MRRARDMQQPQFDPGRLRIRPLADRDHDLSIDDQLDLNSIPDPIEPHAQQSLEPLSAAIIAAASAQASIMMFMGAHVIRAGVSRHLIDLMQRGYLTHLAMNGAGPIHDYELARVGATCESVARYIRSGEFGLWRETGELNDIVRDGHQQGFGLGQAIGKAIAESDYPHRDTSVLAAAWRLQVPVTVHIGIGYDILHEHPNFDAAAYGAASYQDFLHVCDSVSNLEGGVMMCCGTAVMGPEVYLKALAMARNVAHQEGRQIRRFTTAAFDLLPIAGDFHQEAAKSNPQYYYRPWKTVLVRTVADGGTSFYIQGDHRHTIPHLRNAVLKRSATVHGDGRASES